MSALEIPQSHQKATHNLHVVREGEKSAHYARQQWTQTIIRRQQWLTVRTYAALTAAATIFITMSTTMIVGFLAIPNTP